MPRTRVLFALGIVAACTLALQVIITRLFSSVLAYHFGFLAISLALLGTGAGALLVYVRPHRFRTAALEDLLARWCGIFSLFLIALPFLLVQLDFSSGRDAITGRFAANLALACVFASLPSFGAGVVVTLTISSYARTVGRVYAFDLVGAGIGALIIVPVLWLAPAPDLLVWLGGLAAFASLLFAGPRRRTAWIGPALLAVSVGMVWLSSGTNLLYLNPRYVLPNDVEKVSERWTPLARVFGYRFPRPAAFSAVFYDRVYAPVPMPRSGGLPNWWTMGTGPQSIGYELIDPGRVLIIGGGGGRDIYTALAAGELAVDVIELNPGIRRVVDEDLASVSGSPYSRSRVSTTIGDGRSILAARHAAYDSIHIGFTDTLSANAAQGFALTENNLYTLEAFELYFDHLAPRGVLNVSRQLRLVGDEAMRITVLVLTALRNRGVAEPTKNIVVIRGRDILGEPYATVLARLDPFSATELERIRTLAEERGQGVLFGPGGPYRGEWKDLGEADRLEDFCNAYPLDVCPPTDDRPFFFSMRRLSDLGRPNEGYIFAADPISILALTLCILLALSALGFVLPLFAVEADRRPTAGALSFFGAIGMGFMLLEIVLIQRFVLFLGYPTYALSVVLAALLFFSGLGAGLTGRWTASERALRNATLVSTLVISGGAIALPTLLGVFIALPFAARVALAMLMIAPFGLSLGMAMPLGLRRFEAMYAGCVPYAWAVNGIASVVASVLGVFVAIYAGFVAESLLAGACYGYAAAIATWGSWDVRGAVNRERQPGLVDAVSEGRKDRRLNPDYS